MAETTEPLYQKGDRVEYIPVGGKRPDNVAHSTGKIVDVLGSDEKLRYHIKNDRTDKTTGYLKQNIIKKLESTEVA